MQTTDEYNEFVALWIVFLCESALHSLDVHERCLRVCLVDVVREERRLERQLPIEKQRPSWDEFSNRLSDMKFQRNFRMPRNAFDRLCLQLEASVGDSCFRSESFLDNNMHGKKGKLLSMHAFYGGELPGEVKVAVTLRMLSGGSYLDLENIFCVCHRSVYASFHQVVDWVVSSFQFNLPVQLEEKKWGELKLVSEKFAAKTGGLFWGAIGALDGLAIRIKCPTKKDGINDPGNYFCRKGFYALNVQAICDRDKRFTWVSCCHKGSTHDSTAFAETRLMEILQQMSGELWEEGFFIVGDQAYPISSFLMVPYPEVDPTNDPVRAKDSFNYYLSSERIFIECAFGELIMRWGIFWSPLRFELGKSTKIVEAAMLLHNHIVDCRNENEDDIIEQEIMDFSSSSCLPGHFPMVSDNNELNRGGRRKLDDGSEKGQQLRDNLMLSLSTGSFVRPLAPGMKYNQAGHIYMDH